MSPPMLWSETRASDSTRSDDTGCNELLNLGTHPWILKMLLCSLRVFIEILQDRMQYWVLHESLDLRVCHCMPNSILIHFSTALGGIDLVQCAVNSRPEISIFRVKLQSLLVPLQCLVVLLHPVMAVCSPFHALNKRRVNFQCAFTILQSVGVLPHLHVARGAVAVECMILRISLDGLIVFLDGLRILVVLKQFIASFFGLLRLIVIQICLDVTLLFELLHRMEFGEGVCHSMLYQ
mmetsp:Transcript_70479/g.117710  ORF Transcript_70479/g.117710 Transcript_70479/m.117710 type:complete len:236 (+) Transcript_70479:309-1016(+)